MKHGNILNINRDPPKHIPGPFTETGISTTTVLSQVKLENKYLHLHYDLQDYYRTPAPAVCVTNTKQIILSPKDMKTWHFIGITFKLVSSILSLSHLHCRSTEDFCNTEELLCAWYVYFALSSTTEIPIDKVWAAPGGKSMLKLHLHENKAAQFPRPLFLS